MLRRYRLSKTWMVNALFSSLVVGALVARVTCASPNGVVDLDGDTHHDPPASTTDTATSKPAATTDSDKAIPKNIKERRDAAKDEEARAKLKLRAGERIDGSPSGQAQVLGMALQEGGHERVKVVDVAMNSPAFDAGVMKGDEIVAFQGFRGESYRKWIDGIRRLTTDTGAGLKIPVVVARDGNQLTVRIAVPEKLLRPSTPRPLAQPGNPQPPPGLGPATPPGNPTAVAVNGGNNVAIGNSGPFREFFGGAQAAGPSERAMAQIVRIGGQPQPNPGAAQSPAAGAAAAPINGSARIGLAGFRDDPSGMVVMVDVGALPPGNYTVGISDPSVIRGAGVAAGGAADPNAQAPSQATQPQAPAPAPNGGGLVPRDTAPAPGASEQQGSLPPASDRFIPRTVLAQVGSTTNPANANPASGNTGDSAQQAQAATSGGQNGGNGTLNQIGTITVDQSGTGRMQQKVESVQVRNVVGQAIVLYAQGGSPQTTLPSNLNGSARTASRQGVVDSSAAPPAQGATDANGGQATRVPQTPASPPTAAGSRMPVAGGIIQLMTDRRPPPTTDPQTSQAPGGSNGAVEQPGSSTPPAGQNPVR